MSNYKSFEQWAEAMSIFAKYSSECFALGSEHDIIHAYYVGEDIIEGSEDYKRLKELGWDCDDGWYCYT